MMPSRPARPTPTMSRPAPRVLLVDDEKDFVKLLAKRLTRRNLDVRVAHTAEDALQTLADQPIDVVVLDVRLPGVDGLTTLGDIRRVHPDTRVVMLTGFADASMAARALEAGAAAYLVKPVDVAELVARIREALESRPPSFASTPDSS